MDPTQIAGLMAKLGIEGMDPTKVAAAMELVQLLGEDVGVDEEDVQAYFPADREESMFVPKASRNFYYDSKVLRKLVTPNLSHLGNLHTPNLDRLRELGRLGRR